MKLLLLGGTGVISTACTRLALERGHEVTLLTRSGRGLPPGAHALTADIADPRAAAAALAGSRWDAVVDFLAYDAAAIEARLALFRGNTAQYVFISTASAYRKPPARAVITEDTPRENCYWQYSRLKIAAEARLTRAGQEEGFPYTIIRPSLTYGDTVFPLALNCWTKSFTNIARLRAGKGLIVPGDGLTPWTITHNSDFAQGLLGLLGHPGALGEAFHITSEEAPTWNELYTLTAATAGVAQPRLVHIPSEFITECLPEYTGTLLGDKANPALFDLTKLRRLVPGYAPRVPFREGIARTLRWFDADPARQGIDAEVDAKWDRLIAAYERGLAAARAEFASRAT
ncbi:MAG: NAD-dependent epimerase/dehydratase family protein [Verrucomicrobia bacterium]|nr:NAD-dependent epimerase/dehydratase family protein [Verrucomicrobiota bacterium]